MSEPHVLFGCIALSTAAITLLNVGEAMGLSWLPFGGSPEAQLAIVYLTPIGTVGLGFALYYICKAFKMKD